MHEPSCGRCDAVYDVATWSDLPLVERLDRERVVDLLTEWPWSNDAVLELRRCRCGEEIVSLRKAIVRQSVTR